MNVDDNTVVFWDHGSGEAADFIVLRPVADGGVSVILYHCKSAGGAEPGNRVGDVYEVCAQAVKSIIWCDLPRLMEPRLTEVLAAANSHRVGKYLIEGLFDVEPVG